MPLTRRQLLRLGVIGSVAAAATPALRPGAVRGAAGASTQAFPHGVASGDPLADRVILWTRVSVAPSPAVVPVRWEVAADAGFAAVLRSGTAHTDASRDWTVKVDVDGLAPGTTYWYRFSTRGATSRIGRTRTAPSGSPASARLAVVTCADATRGLYNAYARVAERNDIDVVVHLGDYIYEHGRTDRVRPHVPPKELVTVDDYRGRYAAYRLDQALADLHANHPVIWVWDDHETVDGTWMHGADPSNHGDDPEDGEFEARKLAARTAAYEWLPIRLPDPTNLERIYRRFAWGDLFDLFMLDTRRIGRDRQGEPNVEGGFFEQTGEFADPSRHILGSAQERWLTEGLTSSTAVWRLLGNQVVFSPIKVLGAPRAAGGGVFANPDQWDGYQPARDRLVASITAAGVRDLVVLTGDVHAAMAYDIALDPNNPAAYDPATGRGSIGVELVTPSVSSAGDPKPLSPGMSSGDFQDRLLVEGDEGLKVPNPHLRYIDAAHNGYLIADLDRERVRAEFWTVPTVLTPTSEQALAKTFVVRRGRARLEEPLPSLIR